VVPVNYANFLSRLAQIADSYEFYRVVRWDLEILPVVANNGSATDALCVGVSYIPEVVTVTTTSITLANASQAPCFCIVKANNVNSLSTGEINRHNLHVSRSTLLGTPTKWWYITDPSTSDEITQGSLIFSVNVSNTSVATVIAYMVHYTVEFKSPSLNALTLFKPVGKGLKLPPIKTLLVEEPDEDEEKEQVVVIRSKKK
jgi:hypothetical protein